jgi:hypothetical protein
VSRRRPAFDPARLDDLDDLLPVQGPQSQSPPATQPSPVGSEPEPASSAGPMNATSPPDESRVLPPSNHAPARMPRGQGGRPVTRRTSAPTREVSEQTGRVPVAVRIPRLLYEDVNNDLLAGPERASYGQLVIWTCEDHPESVAASVSESRPRPGSRLPRGRRLAAETVQVTLRLTLDERALLDDIINEVRTAVPGTVTRTEVAIAALKLALTHAPN